MMNFDHMLSALAAIVALISGLFAAVLLVAAGYWLGLACIPLFPFLAVVGIKLWLGSDA